MAQGVFDRSIVTVACERCGHRNERTVGWMKQHIETECDSCGENFSTLRPELARPASEVDRTMSGLREMLRSRPGTEIEEPEKRRRFWRR